MNSNDENSLVSRPLDRDLVVVDVGCRGGFADPFIQHIDMFLLYGFEPDQNECRRLEQFYATDRVTLVPTGLSDREGKTRLYLTKDPACSSIYEPNSQLTENYPSLDCAHKVNEAEINLTTLDLWAEGADIQYIDHIKIDTQGSELLVLKGAENLLDKVRTLEIEVEFNPIYKGQPLFADVDSFLRQRGFVLWKLTNLVHYGRNGESSIEIGEDGVHYNDRSQSIKKCGGQLYWADAHYVREEIAQAAFTTQQQLTRDIVLLENLKYLDLADRLKQTIASNA